MNFFSKLPFVAFLLCVSLFFIPISMVLARNSRVDSFSIAKGSDTPVITQLQEVSVLGSRATPRTTLNTPVPIDILDIKSISSAVPQYTTSSLLNLVAPSFTSVVQPIADGMSFSDPAMLRGLSPDQTLVLINGKRRYQSALIYNNDKVGRGSVSTDLNAIPVSMIDNIEILRDGASAIYGSDAVAGVININLKKNIGHTSASVYTGTYMTQYQSYTYPDQSNFLEGMPTKYIKTLAVDGFAFQFNANHGFSLNKKNPNDFINVGITYDNRSPFNRAGEYTGQFAIPAYYTAQNPTITHTDAFLAQNNLSRNDYKYQVGQSAIQNLQIMFNGNVHINTKHETDFYFFGGYGHRWGMSTQIFRFPFDYRNNLSIYPYGFQPHIHARIQDYSLALGIKGKWASWDYDVSNTIGGNVFGINLSNSVNTSNPDSKQTGFNIGALSFLQNTTNIDFNKNFKVLYNLNVAFGAEVRVDNYQQIQGEESSWANYQRHNKSTGKLDLLNGDTVYSILLANGSIAPPEGGVQGYSGFSPTDALNRSRIATGVYGDVALDITKDLLLDIALRLEQYSDFGFNPSERIAIRYNINKNVAIRVSGSTGFRAPSLQQQYFSSTITRVIGSGATPQILTTPPTSEVVKLLGGTPLKPEISYNGSGGITLGIQNFKFTIDGYYTYIKDRILYTDPIAGNANGTMEEQKIYSILSQSNASQVSFFTNAVNTQTYGVDAVLSYFWAFSKVHFIHVDLSGTYSQTDIVGEVKTTPLLASKKHLYLSPINQSLMTTAFPRTKANLMINYMYKKWSFFLRESFVGPVTVVGGALNGAIPNADPIYSTNSSIAWYLRQEVSSRFLTDISISYQFTKWFKATIGVNNLFDIYSDLIQANKAVYEGLQTNPNSSDYNKRVSTKTYRDLGFANSSLITTDNQFNYAIRTTQIGIGGRYLFARLEINLDYGKR